MFIDTCLHHNNDIVRSRFFLLGMALNALRVYHLLVEICNYALIGMDLKSVKR